MNVLGIETSCDETGVAVYTSSRGIAAEALASQTALHARFGGVVPELASRDHISKLASLVDRVIGEADLEPHELTAVAYTAGPGLIGALMVGGAYACALAYGLGIRAIPVHHMEGHLLASMLEDPAPEFPFLSLLVSGGHTLLVVVRGLGDYSIIGATLDDAAGEAFDKVARLLSLPYPGGPALAELAERGDPVAFEFPRPLRHRGLDFSFSGLKTAVRVALEAEIGRQSGESLPERRLADIAASFQAAAIDSLVIKCRAGLAATGLERLVVAGGVGANRRLREALSHLGREDGIEVFFPRPSLCTDNGAMIAYAGARRCGSAGAWPPRIMAKPRWPVDALEPPARPREKRDNG
jgi:N6-L-threonylcarbamoyladenine synthase